MPRAPRAGVRRCSPVALASLLCLALAGCEANGTLPGTSSPTPTLSPTPTGTVTPTPTPVAADYKIRGSIVTPNGVIVSGEMTVKGDTITCVDASCPTDASVPAYDAGGYVFPGLVDLHNHVGYDFLAPWTPAHTYGNHNQWQSDSAYATAKAPYTNNQATYACEMTKYAEVGQLISGVTTTEGAPQKPCVDMLVRDVDNYNDLGLDRIRTNVLGISTVTTADGLTLNSQMDAGTTGAYVIHLAEGIDATALGEWDKLAGRNLLRKETVIVHGTALTHAQFQVMGSKQMPLVWSPVSELTLYGATTDVVTAKADGVKISLAPDWTLTGSGSMLDELHAAANWSDANGTPFTDHELVDMVTVNPADAASYGDLLGRLQPGAKADFFVLRGFDGADPYTSLARLATRGDIALVAVAGIGLYGAPDLMAPFETDLSETISVCNQTRTITVALHDGTNLRNETWAQVQSTILSFDATPIDPLACN